MYLVPTRSTLAILLVATLFACTRSSSPASATNGANAVEASGSATTPAPIDAALAPTQVWAPTSGDASMRDGGSNPSADAASTDATRATLPDGAAMPSPAEQLVRDINNASVPIVSRVDAARGVVLVRVIEAMPNGRREIRQSARECAAQLPSPRGPVRRALAELVHQADEGDGFECTELECSVAGMEYQPAYHVRFVRGPGGELQLDSIAQVSEALLPESWIEGARRYVEQSVTRLRQRPCP